MTALASDYDVYAPTAQGNRIAGVGVQFTEGGDAEAARTKIEALLAGMNAEKPTQTM